MVYRVERVSECLCFVFFFQLFEYEENPLKAATLRDDSDTDDDVSSCFHDDDQDSFSEDEAETTNKKTLEWDDSTLSY